MIYSSNRQLTCNMCSHNIIFKCNYLESILTQRNMSMYFLQGGLSSVARVRVSVEDINDNRPTFYPVLYTVSLSTHSAPGTSVVKVTANDPDAGENGRVTYRAVPAGGTGFFTLNKDTGMSVCVFVDGLL